MWKIFLVIGFRRYFRMDFLSLKMMRTAMAAIIDRDVRVMSRMVRTLSSLVASGRNSMLK